MVQLFLLGMAAALALGSIFLYALSGVRESGEQIRFTTPPAVVNTYITSLRTLETAYIDRNSPVTLDAILSRLTDMRVPQEVLDIHLRTVFAVEQMKKETLSEDETRLRLLELFTRMRLAAEKIIL